MLRKKRPFLFLEEKKNIFSKNTNLKSIAGRHQREREYNSILLLKDNLDIVVLKFIF